MPGTRPRMGALAVFFGLALLVQTAIAAPCVLEVPPNPLTATGLATPYKLSGGCSMSVPGTECFVEGAVYDPATNTISVYNPLVIDNGTTPAVAPVLPKLPDNAVVALWFGSNNGGGLQLIGDTAGGNCVNGLIQNGQLSIFNQFAYCNAPTFFALAANVNIPPLGKASDGQPCLTTRDFGLVDQDQSDNVVTSYLLKGKQTAQNTIANQKKLTGATTLLNGSDNLLLVTLDKIMGCQPMTAPDLAETSAVSLIPSLALNELSAAKNQQGLIAIVPDNDPMTTMNGATNTGKTSLYRVGVNQPVSASGDAKTYCTNLANVAPARYLANKALFSAAPPLDPAVGNNMFNFLAARFVAAFGAGNLNCTGFGLVSPINVTTDANGVAIDAQINVNANTNTNTVTNNPALIAGAVGGGLGGLIVLGAAFTLVRRRSRRSSGQTMQATNPGFQGFQQMNVGGGFGQAFNNFRQSIMQQPAQWGQSIRASMNRFGGGNMNMAPAPNTNTNMQPWMASPMAPPRASPGMPPMYQPNQNNAAPGPFGSAAGPYGYPGGSNPSSPYGASPSAPYGGNTSAPYGSSAPPPFGTGAPQYMQQQQPYGGGYGGPRRN